MLSQYGKRFLRQKTQRETAKKVETRDAILWDILPDQKLCRVKIIGSNTLIAAHYPENWQQTPAYMKPGNAVRIQHTGGNRNRVVIIGNGATIPTPTGSSLFPTPNAGPDAVLSGCKVKATDSGMSVYVQTGTYRISGTNYSLGVFALSETTTITLAMGVPLDTTAAVKVLDAASSTLYRFDLLVVGTDGVIDLIKGTGSATNPQMPATPTGRVVLGWVFVPPNTTAITDSLINRPFAAPTASILNASVVDNDLAWAELTTDITVTVLDQYQRSITGTSWGVKAEFINGNGTLDGLTEKTRYTGTSSNSVTFEYARGGLDPGDESPLIKFSLVQNPDVQMQTVIMLRDSSGDFMG